MHKDLNTWLESKPIPGFQKYDLSEKIGKRYCLHFALTFSKVKSCKSERCEKYVIFWENEALLPGTINQKNLRADKSEF